MATVVFPIALVVAVLATACASGSTDAFPDLESAGETVPPITAPDPLPDTRRVPLGRVDGQAVASDPVEVRGGDVLLTGTVSGPDGRVGGATVRLERFVGLESGFIDVRTDGAGKWRAPEVHGGRYRLRAWQAPTLSMTNSELRFVRQDVGESERIPIALTISEQDGDDLQVAVGRSTAQVGDTIALSGLATVRRVDDEGIVVTRPLADAVARASASGSWSLLGPASAPVAADGAVTWRLRCDRPGPASAEVRVAGQVARVTAQCVTPPPSATAPSTTTTVPGPDPDPDPDPQFAVGESFTPPRADAIPIGTYAVTAHTGTCALTYQAFVSGAWEPGTRTVTGTDGFSLAHPARGLRPLGTTPACTYQRVS